MRGKKAKAIRAFAQDKTIGKPWASYDPVRNRSGNVVRWRLAKDCGRYLYQRLKAQV